MWSSQYHDISAAMPDQTMNHVAHVHTGSRLLGAGVEAMALNGNQVEAEVQLGIWISGLVSWTWERRNRVVSPPPVVGCICIGDRWDFYIIYGLEGPDTALSEACVWGPLADWVAAQVAISHPLYSKDLIGFSSTYSVGILTHF